MPEEEDVKKQEESKDSKDGKNIFGVGIVTWIVIAVIIVLCAGSGLVLGRLFAGPATTQTDKPSEKDEPIQTKDLAEDLTAKDSATADEKAWYYDLDPAVANLDEPGVTRYIRVTLTLQMDSALEESKGTKLLEDKKPVLANWVTVYLAGLTLEDVRGDRNLRRIQSEILDAFNEKLFPDAKPHVRLILFKEFVIQ